MHINKDKIRNFSIISHVDHGKSTLSDRILEITHAVDPRNMRAQYLDSMDIERERGITIKAQNVRVHWKDYILNLIDTPGHVDFGYEVSRSLAACEGVILLVDSTQGIQAQTLANCYLAVDHNLEIIPVLNKIDLPASDVERCKEEIKQTLGIDPNDILSISAKTGQGIEILLDTVIEKIPPPTGDSQVKLQALIFDSYFDQFRGVISSIRVINGEISQNSRLLFMHSKTSHEVEEIGTRNPDPTPVDVLGAGEVGYVIANVRNVSEAPPGETVTDFNAPASNPLGGYKQPQPMVYCGLYPIDGDEFSNLKEALTKLKLNDASVTYEPETSSALGFGFRCGFLGLLHMEIVRERLEREFNLSLIATAPSVNYRIKLTNNKSIQIDNPNDLPSANQVQQIEEPILIATILTPAEYTGTVMELCQLKRGEMIKMDYLSQNRVELKYKIPLGEVVIDFFDSLKSRTKGYASLDYEQSDYQPANLVKVELLINGISVDAFSMIVHKSKAQEYGKKMTEKLRELIPRQLFDVPIQAAIGGKIISRETIKARRKDVLAKCYGGDITRKRKLLEKQKEGKKKMKSIGRVEVPQEAFISALKIDS
jgi:GTP-binding protein LepA